MPWAAARDRFAEAVGAGYGASYGATVIKGLQKTTLDGYLRQVRRLAKMERMRPGIGARKVLETHLMDIVDGEQSKSAAKLVLSAARLVEKMGWIKPVVRVADWYLLEALEARRTNQERSAAKEWAQVGDLVSLCASARSFADWEAVALACISVAHCMRRSGLAGRWESPTMESGSLDPNPGEENRSKTWGRGAESGWRSWENCAPSEGSTPTRGPDTAQGTPSENPWWNCWKGGEGDGVSGIRSRNSFDGMIVARSEELAKEAFSRMDVHLDLNMSMIRPLDGLQQAEYRKEFGEIYKRLEKRLEPVVVNQEQWKRDKSYLWYEVRIVVPSDRIPALLKWTHESSGHAGADCTLLYVE